MATENCAHPGAGPLRVSRSWQYRPLWSPPVPCVLILGGQGPGMDALVASQRVIVEKWLVFRKKPGAGTPKILDPPPFGPPSLSFGAPLRLTQLRPWGAAQPQSGGMRSRKRQRGILIRVRQGGPSRHPQRKKSESGYGSVERPSSSAANESRWSKQTNSSGAATCC